MLIQVIQGKVKDADLLRRQIERWRYELKPGATGYLGSTSGITPDGRGITMARFVSEQAARANSARAEQSAWWNETEKAFDSVAFQDCHDVDMLLGGGSDDAGFVQVIQGRAKDEASMRAQVQEMQAKLREARPDILGVTIAWHGDGGFTQAIYFRTEQEARLQEKATEDDEMQRRFLALFDGPPTFFDLPEPDLD